MKQKLTLLLLALVTSIGAWADVTMPTLTTDANNPVLYCIQSYRSYYYEQYSGDDAAITPTFDFSSANAKFYFVPVNGSNLDEGVKIVSSANGKQLVDVGTGFADEGTTWYIKENPYNAGFVCISKTSDLSSGCWDCNSNGVMTTDYWQPASGDADGTSWSIVKDPQYETSTLENPKWYYIKTGRGRYVYADGTNAGTNTSNPKTEAYKFAFISVGGTGVNIVSKVGLANGSNQYLTTTPALSDTPSTWYYFGAARYPGYFLFSDNASAYGNSHLLNDNGNGGLAKWYVEGIGSYFQVEEVLPVCDVTYTYTYNGNTYSATETQNIGDAVSLPASITFPYTNYSFSTDVVPDASTATVNVTVTGFDMPFVASNDYASATWYYIKGHSSYNNYYISTGTENAIGCASGMSRTDAYKWAFIGNPIDGVKVINKASGDGYYINGTEPATMGKTVKAWALKQQTNASYNTNSGGKGFGFYDASLTYLNCRPGTPGNIKYWSGFDQGSTFWIAEDVDAVTSDKNVLAQAISEAQVLVAAPGVPGYPTAEATLTLNDILSSAQTVYADASGDYGAAYISLSSAIATAKDNINYTPRTDVYYTITSERGSMVYDSSHDSSVDGDGNYFLWYTTSLDNTNVNHLWGFIEKDGNYYMYNVGKKQFATVSTTGGYQRNDKGTWVFSNTPAYVTFDAGINNSVAAPSVRVRATIATTETTYSMSISTGYTGPVITYDVQGDVGIPMILATSTVAVDDAVTAAIEALIEDLTPYRNALKSVIDGCASIEFGTGLNQYTTNDANDAYTTALAEANAVYEDVDATKSDLQTAKNNLESAISGLAINQPAAGSFLRVRSVATGKGYVNAENVATNNLGNVLAVGSKAKKSIYYYQDGKLLAYNNGQYFVKNNLGFASLGEVGTDGASIVFGTGTKKKGTYYITFGGRYLYAGDSATATDAADSEADNCYDFWLEQVTELPVTINSIDGHGFASFYTPVDIASLPTGVKAYIATLTTTRVQFSEITSIPAGTAVVLYMPTCTESTEVNLPIGTASANTDGNVLRGNVATVALGEQEVLTMQNGANGVGFYKYNGTNLNLAGFKAFINISDIPASVKGFSFDFVDDATGMSEELRMKNEESKSAIYNLAGQRLSKPAKGINIVNGKKVMVK